MDNPRNCVFASVGVGKTTSVLNALDTLFMSGSETKPALVLAPPLVAASTWPDEVEKWDHLRNIEIVPLVGTPADRERLLRKPASVYTLSYQNIPWIVETLKDKWPFNTVIADESTQIQGLRISERTSKTGKKFLSGQGTVRAKALAKIAYSQCTRWCNLTASPTANHLSYLWGMLWYCDYGKRLGKSFDSFSRRWFRPSYDGYSIMALPNAQTEIQNLIKDICLSVTIEASQKPIENVIRIPIPNRAREIYEKMKKQLFAEINSHEIEAANAASKTVKLHQLANGAIYTDDQGKYEEIHDVKLQKLENIINESAGAPILVSYTFKSDLERLQRAFPKAQVLDARNPAIIKDWNKGNIPLLLAHPASAGHGLNLQDGGNILVFFSVDWNLELHEQIIGRIGPTRQAQAGHKRPVFIHYILAKDTIDEAILERLQTKKSIQEILLAALKRV